MPLPKVHLTLRYAKFVWYNQVKPGSSGLLSIMWIVAGLSFPRASYHMLWLLTTLACLALVVFSSHFASRYALLEDMPIYVLWTLLD